MDTTHTDALLVRLGSVDPAEAADLADELAEQLAAVLEDTALAHTERSDGEDR